MTALRWRDESMALHWIDRYASGIDAEPQMLRILACVEAESVSPSQGEGPAPEVVDALERLRDATPQSTNTVSAEGAFAYVHAVAATALASLAPQGGEGAE